jgi:hypothetical protein
MGERRELSINNLTARILCSRHNSSLSLLDDAAGGFLRTIHGSYVDLQRRSVSLKREYVLISGEAIERWMLKVALGLFYSRIAARDGHRLIEGYSMSRELAHEGLFAGRWRQNCGLYVHAPFGHVVTTESTLTLAPLIALEEARFLGLTMKIAGMEFMLIFDPAGQILDDMDREGWVLRPSEIYLGRQTRSHSLILTWLPGTPQRSIQMIYGGRVRAGGLT